MLRLIRVDTYRRVHNVGFLMERFNYICTKVRIMTVFKKWCIARQYWPVCDLCIRICIMMTYKLYSYSYAIKNVRRLFRHEYLHKPRWTHCVPRIDVHSCRTVIIRSILSRTNHSLIHNGRIWYIWKKKIGSDKPAHLLCCIQIFTAHQMLHKGAFAGLDLYCSQHAVPFCMDRLI